MHQSGTYMIDVYPVYLDTGLIHSVSGVSGVRKSDTQPIQEYSTVLGKSSIRVGSGAVGATARRARSGLGFSTRGGIDRGAEGDESVTSLAEGDVDCK